MQNNTKQILELFKDTLDKLNDLEDQAFEVTTKGRVKDAKAYVDGMINYSLNPIRANLIKLAEAYKNLADCKSESQTTYSDTERLDYYENFPRNFHFNSNVTMCGKHPSWGYWSPKEGRSEETRRKTLREAIDAVLDGGGASQLASLVAFGEQ